MTGIGCEHRSDGQCQGGEKNKTKEKSCWVETCLMYHFCGKKDIRRNRGEIYIRWQLNVNLTCDSAPCVMRREGNSPTLGRSATDATISISKAHTSRPHWHPPIPLPPTPNTMSPSSRLSSASWLLSLSWSRCSVAIATEKCGNTSVLQNAGRWGGF